VIDVIRCFLLHSNTAAKVVLHYTMYAKTTAIVILREAQLMLTNPRDAFRGPSRSPSMVPFHMLGIVSF